MALTTNPGEVTSHLATVAVLEPQHDVASASGEGHGGAHTVAARLRTWPEQRESAGGAHSGTRGVTTSTTNLQHHGLQHDDGVSQGSR